MKPLVLLIASLLIAETHHFKEVNFEGKTIKNVALVIQENTYTIWHRERLLKPGVYMIVSCRAREKFCLVENDSSYGWIEER